MSVDSVLGTSGLKPGTATSATRPTAPYVGQVIYETDTLQAMVWNGTLWVPLALGKNVMVNGSFEVWQRGPGAFTASGAWNADRWYAQSAGGDTMSISRQAAVLGAIAGYEPKYFHRTVVTSAGAAGSQIQLNQAIEGVRTLAGRVVTLSFWGKASIAKTIALGIHQFFGTTGGSSNVTTNIGQAALTAAWQRFAFTFTLPSISGKTLGSAGDDSLTLNVWLNAGANYVALTGAMTMLSATVDLAGFQLEANEGPSPFDQRLSSEELAMCQRYYYAPFYLIAGPAYTPMNGGGVAASTIACNVDIILPVPMRAAPNAFVLNGAVAADFLLVDRMANIQTSSAPTFGAGESSTLSASLICATAGSLTAGRYYKLFRFSNTIQPGFSAETQGG